MDVLAFSTPLKPDWRWRIVDYGGETIEESYTGFATIALAIAEGTARLRRQSERDVGTVSHPAAPMSPRWRR